MIFVMSLPLLYPKTLGMNVLSLNLPLYCHMHLPCIMGFDIIIIHQRNHITHSHASHCRCCNVDIVLFRNVTCYANFVLSCFQVDTTHLLNITCIVLATCMILGMLQCIHMNFKIMRKAATALNWICKPSRSKLIMCSTS